MSQRFGFQIEIAELARQQHIVLAAAGPLPTGARIVAVGDSIIQFGHLANPSLIANRADGEIAWAKAVSPRFRHSIWRDPTAVHSALVPTFAEGAAVDPLFRGANLGLAGDTTTGMARRLKVALATGAEVVLLSGGTNFGSGDAPVSVVTENLSLMVDAIIAAGRRCIIATIRPRRTATVTGRNILAPQGMQRILRINEWIRAQASRPGIALWDPWEALRDRSYRPGDPLHGNDAPGMTRDGVHLTPRGAFASATSYAHGAVPLVAAVAKLIAPGLWFDPASKADELLPDGTFMSAPAASVTDASLKLPSSWNIATTGIGGGLPAVAMSGNRDSGGQSLTLSWHLPGQGGPSQYVAVRLSPSRPVANGFSPSDFVSAFFEIEVPGSPAIVCFQAALGQGSETAARGLGQTTGAFDSQPYPDTPFRGWLQTESLHVGTRNSLLPRLEIILRTDIAAKTSLTVRRALLRKVPDPRAEFRWWP
jgi:lysophospholipase L1-like esterase